MDSLSNMPFDILLIVVNKLKYSDIRKLLTVNKTFNSLIKNNKYYISNNDLVVLDKLKDPSKVLNIFPNIKFSYYNMYDNSNMLQYVNNIDTLCIHYYDKFNKLLLNNNVNFNYINGVTKLYLNNCKDIDENILNDESFLNISELYLQSTNITNNTINNCFSNKMKKLKKLDLSYTNISNISNLSTVPFLEELNLNSCKNINDYSLETGSLNKFKSLKILNLCVTNITDYSLENGFLNIPNLKSLYLICCKNITERYLEHIILNNTNLELLDVSYCSMNNDNLKSLKISNKTNIKIIFKKN